MARRLVLSSVRWPGDICLCCAHLDFLLVSMLLLMLFSSLVLARPRLSVPPSQASSAPPPVATPPPPPLCCLTMLDQVVYLSVILGSSSGKQNNIRLLISYSWATCNSYIATLARVQYYKVYMGPALSWIMDNYFCFSSAGIIIRNLFIFQKI